jgi:hypothetical protein
MIHLPVGVVPVTENYLCGSSFLHDSLPGVSFGTGDLAFDRTRIHCDLMVVTISKLNLSIFGLGKIDESNRIKIPSCIFLRMASLSCRASALEDFGPNSLNVPVVLAPMKLPDKSYTYTYNANKKKHYWKSKYGKTLTLTDPKPVTLPQTAEFKFPKVPKMKPRIERWWRCTTCNRRFKNECNAYSHFCWS